MPKRFRSNGAVKSKLFADFLAKGAKCCIGRKGFIKLERDVDYDSEDGEVYFPVRVSAVGMDGCTPEFRCEPIGGTGTIILKSACQFKDSLQAVRQQQAHDKRVADKEECERKLMHRYGSDAYLTKLRDNLFVFIRDRVPKGIGNKRLVTEAGLLEANLSDMKSIKREHINVLAKMAIEEVFPDLVKKSNDDERE